MDVKEKAQEIWNAMDDNQRTGVRIGMFPYLTMDQAEKQGYNGRELSLALMDIAKNNGGMIA